MFFRQRVNGILFADLDFYNRGRRLALLIFIALHRFIGLGVRDHELRACLRDLRIDFWIRAFQFVLGDAVLACDGAERLALAHRVRSRLRRRERNVRADFVKAFGEEPSKKLECPWLRVSLFLPKLCKQNL